MLSEVISIIIICMILIAAMSISCYNIVQMADTVRIVREVYLMNAYVWNIQFSNEGVHINELIINNTGKIPFVISMIYDGVRYRRYHIVLYPGQAVRIHIRSAKVLVEICSLDFKVCKYVVATVNFAYAPAPLAQS